VTADDRTPFYVGKGTGHRFSNHLAPSLGGVNGLKAAAIAATRAAGGHFCFTFPVMGVDEDEAHQIELATIRKIGRSQVGAGPLTNMTDGGDGMTGLTALKGLANKRLKPVVIDGTEYPGLVIAAERTGIHYNCLLRRIRSGWPGYYYVDEGPRRDRRKKVVAKERRWKPVVAEGIEYASLTLAATALGVHPPCISRRIKHGWEGYFYKHEGQRPRSRPVRYSEEHRQQIRETLEKTRMAQAG
jgi:hypothetical protein